MERLNFFECLQLLGICTDHNLMKRDPREYNNLIVYRQKQGKFPEGWYSMPIDDVAGELVKSVSEQRYLKEELEKLNIPVELVHSLDDIPKFEVKEDKEHGGR